MRQVLGNLMSIDQDPGLTAIMSQRVASRAPEQFAKRPQRRVTFGPQCRDDSMRVWRCLIWWRDHLLPRCRR
jgi:hypothetical protein